MLDGPLKVMSKACHHITLYSLDSSQACAARRVVFGGFRATFVCRRHAHGRGCVRRAICQHPCLLPCGLSRQEPREKILITKAAERCARHRQWQWPACRGSGDGSNSTSRQSYDLDDG